MTTKEIEAMKKFAETEENYYRIRIEQIFGDEDPIIYDCNNPTIIEAVKSMLSPHRIKPYQVMSIQMGVPMTAMKPVAEFDNFVEAQEYADKHNASIDMEKPEPGACTWVAVSREETKRWMIEQFHKDNNIT